MEHVLHAFAIASTVCAGLLAGSELAVAAFFHPALYNLPEALHTRAAQKLARTLGAVMPFWYAASLVFAASLAFLVRGQPLVFELVCGAAACFCALIGATVLFLVPINNRIAAWDLAALPADWRRDRSTWDARHRARVAGLIAAFVLLASGLFALG